ncbi:MAG TPA: hypothetical protein VGY55_04615 [Pirellulales bacterium]|jgi:hypothetical protein|nr:hypothetical protein [Pirellulales bacterium]
MTLQDEQRAINEKVRPHIPIDGWNSTVAIVVARGNDVHQFGTGVLFRVAQDAFVITAGHVARKAAENKWTQGLAGVSESIVALSGQWLCTDEDPFDIAVHQLPQSTVDKLKGKVFLRFDDIDFEPQSPLAVFTIFGFPEVWSSPSTNESEKLTLKPFEFTTYRYDRDTAALSGYEERYHLLLDAQPRDISLDDGSAAEFRTLQGLPASFPKDVVGISGCSVWRIGDLRVPIEEWGRDRARIVAVQTSVYSGKAAIKATRWIAVSTLIHDAFPELRPAMTLWRRR